MSLQRFQKKLVLLRYKDNKLWERYGRKNPKPNINELVDDLLGVHSHKNIIRWISDDDPHPIFDRKRWSMNISKELGGQVRTDLLDDSVRSSKFGHELGLPRQACKYLIDCVYAEKGHLFDSLVYEKRHVETFINEITGLYKLYLFIPDRRTFVPGALSVRYYLPINSLPSKNKGYRVRCKCVILAKNEHKEGDDQLVEYDGYLSYETKTISFSFESRQLEGERLKMFLSFTNELISASTMKYYFGGYCKSQSLAGTANNFGPAALSKIYSNRRSIRNGSNLKEVDADYNREKQFEDIVNSPEDKGFIAEFLKRHGWIL
jgi:hypothetical protein